MKKFLRKTFLKKCGGAIITILVIFYGFSSLSPAQMIFEQKNIDTEESVQMLTPPQYNLTVNTVGNGYVDLDPPGGVYYYGTTVILEAFADPGWTFDHWSGDLTGSDNPDIIIMYGDSTVTAHFVEHWIALSGDCYYINMEPVPSVSVKVTNKDTGEQWDAGTVGNHYTLDIQNDLDVSVGDALRYYANDGNHWDGIKQHVVTQGDVDAGYIIVDIMLNRYYTDDFIVGPGVILTKLDDAEPVPPP